MIWKCQTVTGIFNRNNGTNATQKQKPQTIKSKLVVWDFCFCRIYFLSCAWHTGGAGRGNGYASSGVLPENLGNAGSGNRAESAFPLYKVWPCTRIRAGNTSTHSTVVNFRSTESFNPCPERVTAMTIALWKPSSADWKMKCSMDLRRIITPLKPFQRPLPSILTIIITAESKLKQNGCLPPSPGKHPWWNLNYSILNRCPENWVHITPAPPQNGLYFSAACFFP